MGGPAGNSAGEGSSYKSPYGPPKRPNSPNPQKGTDWSEWLKKKEKEDKEEKEENDRKKEQDRIDKNNRVSEHQRRLRFFDKWKKHYESESELEKLYADHEIRRLNQKQKKGLPDWLNKIL